MGSNLCSCNNKLDQGTEVNMVFKKITLVHLLNFPKYYFFSLQRIIKAILPLIPPNMMTMECLQIQRGLKQLEQQIPK
jgi:hypothetical protein